MQFLKVLLSNFRKKPFVKTLGGLAALFFLTSCDDSLKEIPIQFNLNAHDESVSCKSVINAENGEWKLDQLQFFISEIRLRDNTGKWHTTSLASESESEDNSKSRSSDVALIGVVCADSGTWQVNLETRISKEDIRGIAFTLGVPFDLNHQNPMSLPAPLNQPDMFWTWQTGHKFLRLEMHSENKEFVYHLGSTGCVSSSPVRSPKTECKNPNRVVVTLDDFRPSKTISLDLSKLLKGSELELEISCQSSPDNSQCMPLFKQTGIGSEQQIFQVLPQ